MNSKFKLALLVGAVALALSGCKEEKSTATTTDASNSDITMQSTPLNLETEDQKVAYAIGVSFSELLKEALQAQDANFDKKYVYSGFSENFAEKGQITKDEAAQILADFGQKEEKKEAEKLEKARVENLEVGKKYREEFEKQEGVKKTETGLLYKIETEGKGEHPTLDQIVTINYIGKFVDGREFENTYARNKTVTIPLNGIIKGWEEGLQLMRAGGKAIFVIPPELAYGDNNIPGNKDYPGITPQSTLVFHVELIKITDETEETTPSEPEE